jgi:3-hydroxyisobutyrate dehydrogenase
VVHRIGFIGLGNLGAHLAASLVRGGFEVVVHDLDPARAAPLLSTGAAWGASPREVARSVETVVTCLPSPAAVDAVMTGPDGVLAGLAAGGTWVEMSTNDRAHVQRLADLAADSGVEVLEAPVTGGVHKAAVGDITVLVGGDEEVFSRHIHVFQAIGNSVFHMGPLGNASVIKVITNMLAFIHVVAIGEALMLAKRGGLDLATSFEAIRASSGNSFVHETESQVVLSGSYNIGFTIDLACKDLGFASQMGREFGVPLPLEQLVEQTFRTARSRYGGDAWSPRVIQLLEEAVGDSLRAPGFPEVLTATPLPEQQETRSR